MNSFGVKSYESMILLLLIMCDREIGMCDREIGMCDREITKFDI